MLPLGVFRSRQFTAANAVTFVVYGAPRRAAVPGPRGAAGRPPLLADRGGHVAAPDHLHHARLVGPLGRAGGQDRPEAPDDGRAVRHRRVVLLFIRVGASGDYLTTVLPAVVVFGLGVAIMVRAADRDRHVRRPGRPRAASPRRGTTTVARAAGLTRWRCCPRSPASPGQLPAPGALAHGFKVAAMIPPRLLRGRGRCSPRSPSATPPEPRGSRARKRRRRSPARSRRRPCVVWERRR